MVIKRMQSIDLIETYVYGTSMQERRNYKHV